MATPTIEELITVSIRSEFSKGRLDISERALLHVLAIVALANELHAEQARVKEDAFKRYNGYEELNAVAEV